MDFLMSTVEKEMNSKIKNVYPIGSGATASCYCIEIFDYPFKIVVKTSPHYRLMLEEMKMNNFIRERVHFKIPETYFIAKNDDISYLGMEYIEGVSGRVLRLNQVKDKKHLADNILKCFTDIQSVKYNKFGSYENPTYSTWKEYYWDFFCVIYDFASEKYNSGELDKKTIKALNYIKNNFDEIFSDISNEAVLSHGDFWTPNMIFDTEKSEIAGVVDPFNTRFVEPEYELFCLTLGLGQKLKLYKKYKKQFNVSKYCDLKVELYALCNEIDWWMNLGEIDTIGYIKMRAKRLIRQMKKHKLKR
ncbi:MAG: fructosamine kinase family protein [Clostridia bacterium]|nr:fructosamine kinase family protein [Clostridia bacterium]